ncbi:MAG: ABC transporter permease [Clostridia bacterium]|nr:ABC transporter permease [Clostridia bacterium]
MKRFINDVKKFWNYSVYNVKAELKSEVAGSFLSWVWWILDPLLYMCVYTFVASVVFNTTKEYFPIFVFIGLNCWNLFNKTVRNSVKLVSNKKSIVTKVYIPKYMFILEKIGTNGFKMLVSFLLTFVFMVIWGVPFSFRMFYFIPLAMMVAIVAFAFSSIIMHFGVFVEDLFNIITVGLQLVFYMSGIFYSIEDRIEGTVGKLLIYGNPMALIMTDMRNVLLYDTDPHFLALGIWLAVCLLLSVIGVKIIYKYENSYVKII